MKPLYPVLAIALTITLGACTTLPPQTQTPSQTGRWSRSQQDQFAAKYGIEPLPTPPSANASPAQWEFYRQQLLAYRDRRLAAAAQYQSEAVGIEHSPYTEPYGNAYPQSLPAGYPANNWAASEQTSYPASPTNNGMSQLQNLMASAAQRGSSY
jgi:hypothetical protein